MASYATPAQMLERKDARDIGDLVTDDGSPVSANALLTNTNLLTALADASGDIEGALLVGGRYTTSDLEGLTGNSANHLQRICCEIAMCHLLRRRTRIDSDELAYYEKIREQFLDLLRSGKDVFNVDATISASKATIDGPTTTELEDLNLWRDRTRGYFPRRHLPDNR